MCNAVATIPPAVARLLADTLCTPGAKRRLRRLARRTPQGGKLTIGELLAAARPRRKPHYHYNADPQPRGEIGN